MESPRSSWHPYPMRNLAIGLLLVASLACAQPPAKHKDQDHLVFALIVSRHGIRPPLTPNSKLDLLSSSPWPAWEVPLGYLTPHGGLALQKMGAYMRLDLVRKGLLPASGCPANGDVYLDADTDERNIESTRNTFLGLTPGCALPVNTITASPTTSDPLFSPIPKSFPRPTRQAIDADQRAFMREDRSVYGSVASNPELVTFAHILAPDPSHPAAQPILKDPNPLAAASTPVEDIELEYVDAKPMSDVGWGRVDEATLRRLLPLHVKEFSLVRSPLAARAEASDLMSHILDTLEQAAQSAPVPGAIGPQSAHLVYLSGHDTNLYALGGLLRMHWTIDGVRDPTPPDTQIVFELWRNRRSKQDTVRVLLRAQTYHQLRSAEALSSANPPVEVRLTPPGCRAATPCSLRSFDRSTRSLLDPAYIQTALTPTHVAATTP